MDKRSVRRLALAGLLADQAVAALVRYRYPDLVHSSPFFPLLQGELAWVLVAAGLVLLGRWSAARAGLRPSFYLIGAGFLSNLLSQAFYGGFTDYLPTGFSYINTADLLVVAGCMFLAKELLLGRSD